MNKYKAAFFAACLGMLLFGMSLITLGSVTLWLRERLLLDNISAGTLFSILPVGIIVGSLVFGPVADRYGHKLFFIISTVCLFIGFEGIASLESIPLLQVCIFLFGFGGGAINGGANALVADLSENKSSGLSLLGIFFAIGALSMPSILASLKNSFSYQQIVAFAGYGSLAISLLFVLIPFPPPRQVQRMPLSSSVRKLLKDHVVILVSLFLFCQTAFEAIVNNWATTFLTALSIATDREALYTLSLYVVSMAITRLILGWALTKTSQRTIMFITMAILISGCIFLYNSQTLAVSRLGLIAIGIGLASGFPVMLGVIATRHPQVSGTAFSLVISFALTGNMIINYIMGVVAESSGIRHLTTFCFVLSGMMLILTLTFSKPLKN
jgi:FHS family glucose/mannose:H+ symporter-like MFS transporter